MLVTVLLPSSRAASLVNSSFRRRRCLCSPARARGRRTRRCSLGSRFFPLLLLRAEIESIGFSSSAVAASTSSAAARAAAAAASVVAAALRTASPRPSGVPRVGASAVDEDPPRDDEGVSHDIVVVVVVVAARERPRGLRRDARAAGRGSATFMSATALDMSRRTGARPSRRALTSQILGTPNCQIISFESRSGVIAEGTRGGHGGRE